MREETPANYDVAPRPSTPQPDIFTADEQAVLDQASTILKRVICTGDAMTRPDTVKRYLQLQLRGYSRECFAVLWLNQRNQVIAFDKLFFGTIDSASIHPREVVKSALQRNAAACILTHNHPSGVATPSKADHTITSRISDALSLVDIRTLDHIVIGDDTYSMAEHGQM